MHLLNPLFRLFGDNINRKTVEHVDQAGFVDIEVDELGLDVVRASTPIEVEGLAPMHDAIMLDQFSHYAVLNTIRKRGLY